MWLSKLVCFLALCFVGLAQADTPTLAISSDNTPHDKKALNLLSQEAFRRIGVGFSLVSNPSERSLNLANEGEVDGEGLRIAGLTAQYPNLVQVPERYIGIGFVAFAKNQNINLDKGWESLKDYRIAFITGWKMFEANASHAKSVIKVEKAEQLFQMLDAGRVDLVLYTRADGAALIRSLGLSSIAPLSPALKDADMYLYLNRKHESLAPRIANALRTMKGDGTYKKIMSEVTPE